MAKKVKKIVCPQCGSNDIKEVKSDYYMCNGCRTNFFLDTDDITINHTYSNKGNSRELSVDTSKKIAKVVCVFVGIFVVYQLVKIFLFSPSSPVQGVVSENSGSSILSTKPGRTISPNYKDAHLLQINDSENIVVSLAGFNDVMASENKESLYVVLFDPETGKELQRTKLKVDLSVKGAGMNISSPFTMFQDVKDNLYLIVNKYFLYRFDKNKKQFVVVDHTFFEPYTEFADGIAAMDYNDYSKGLEIVTNMGKKYMFYPDIQKVYPISEKHKVFDLQLPNPELKTSYVFSRSSDDFPTENIQLLEYTQEYQAGYPNDKFNFSWRKDFGGSGIFTDRSPYKKVLILPYTKEKSRVKSYRDISPGRPYIAGGSVLGFDEEGVIVALKLTIADNEAYTIQKLRKTDGHILWSKKTAWNSVNNYNQIKNRILVKTDLYNVVIVDTDGETISTIDLNEIRLEGAAM